MTRIAIATVEDANSSSREVVLQWMRGLQFTNRFELDLLVPTNVDAGRMADASVRGLQIMSLDGTTRRLGNLRYDAALGIGTAALPVLPAIKAKRMGILLQPGDLASAESVSVYFDNYLPVIATTHSQKNALVKWYRYPSARVPLVVNGLDAELARSSTARIPKDGNLRFIVEITGANQRQLCNANEIATLLDETSTPYFWLGAPLDRSTAGHACIGAFENEPPKSLQGLFASADVLITFSDSCRVMNSALQMMSSGGTVIAFDFDDAAEMLAHGFNSLVVSRNDFVGMTRAVKHLAATPALVKQLQIGGNRTAQKWCSWTDQREQMASAMDILLTSAVRHAGDLGVQSSSSEVPTASINAAPTQDFGSFLQQMKERLLKRAKGDVGLSIWPIHSRMSIHSIVKKFRQTKSSNFINQQVSRRLIARRRKAHPLNTLQTHRSFANYREKAGDFTHEAPLTHFLYGFSSDVFDKTGGLASIAKHNEQKRLQRVNSSEPITIAWVHPMFGVGGGGHHNIFRCQRYLKEDFGIESANFLYPTPDSDLSRDKLALEIAELAGKHYDYCGSPFVLDWNQINRFSVHMATTWASTYPILSASESLLRAYFIQDYEPFFFARGGKEFLAQRSYDFGFYPICAGPWLPQQIGYAAGGARAQAHCWYALAVSKEDYYLSSAMTAPNLNPLSARRLRNARPQPRRGVCFYVRASTERRGFDIAFMTINVLKREYPHIPIYTVGMRANELATLKGCTHLGIMSVKDLQKVYSEYAAYVVLSFTNYSLLPAEIIACGGKVIDIKVPSNEASQKLFDPTKYQLCDPDPYKLAYQIATLAGGPQNIDTAPSRPTTWQQEYGKIGNALLEQFGRTPKRQID